MPTVDHERLRSLVAGILEANGASSSEAATVSRQLVAANLAGHDSHGVMLAPRYVQRIHDGHLVPGAPFEIEHETSNTAVVNGNWGFGQVVTERVVELVTEKARRDKVAAIAVHNQGHIGRLGAYAEMIAAEGMIAMLFADSGRSPKAVAPLGGREPRLGTNPMCFAAPSGFAGPVVLDMATSAVAVGKLRLAINEGKQIPEGWILDAEGQPTTDPNDYFNGGVLLPLGGDQAHKGYGLSFIVEMFCGLLTGLGFGLDPQGRYNDGIFLAAFDVDSFRSYDAFIGDMKDFIQYLKETPKAEGATEILYPGELEFRTRLAREEQGIPLSDETWRQLTQLADEHAISAD